MSGSKKSPVSVIILTYNEGHNIEKCLKSVYKWTEAILIVDSHSTDRTVEIASKYTDKIYQHPFETQAQQFNWALDNLPLVTDWIMRLDADEMVTPELSDEIHDILHTLPSDVNGLYLKRRVYFGGKWIKHGGYYPTWLLRIFRRGKGRCEDRLMDEHIVVTEGKAVQLKNDIIDYNRKGLSFWIDKHNRFATREMLEILAEGSGNHNSNNMSVNASSAGFQQSRKRWLKNNVYLEFPLFLRAFLYFIYRYFFRLGFLDGKEGLIFHFLQGFWYRFLVDAKIYEYQKGLRDKD
jgi:glycosyltransferase involved in cell wall biosynthesis